MDSDPARARCVVFVAAGAAVGSMVAATLFEWTEATPWLSTACFVAMAAALGVAYVAGRGRPICAMNGDRVRPLPIGTVVAGLFFVSAFLAMIAAG